MTFREKLETVIAYMKANGKTVTGVSLSVPANIELMSPHFQARTGAKYLTFLGEIPVKIDPTLKGISAVVGGTEGVLSVTTTVIPVDDTLPLPDSIVGGA